MNPTDYCGECSWFRYEDAYGNGICHLDSELHHCSEKCPYR